MNRPASSLVENPSPVESSMPIFAEVEHLLASQPSGCASIADAGVLVEVEALTADGWRGEAVESVDDEHRGLASGVVGREHLGGEAASALVDGSHLEAVEHIGLQRTCRRCRSGTCHCRIRRRSGYRGCSRWVPTALLRVDESLPARRTLAPCLVNSEVEVVGRQRRDGYSSPCWVI